MRRFLITAALAALPVLAAAQDGPKGPNGGMVSGDGHHVVEMVSTGTELTVFLSEDGKPVASAGARIGRAIVQDGGKTATVALRPASPNKLVGTLAQPLGAGARVVVSATMPDGHAVQARFAR